MNNIVVCLLAQWFEILIAKFFIFPYQIGSIMVGDEDTTYRLWISSNISEMPYTSNELDILPLFIGGIMYLHYGYTIIFSVFTLTCERACATYFISDYEKKPRSYICKSLILSTHVFTLIMSFLATFEIVTFTMGIVFSGFVIVGAVFIFFYILHINIKVQNKLEKRDNLNIYSLAIRFQAKENAKSLKLARKIVIFAAFAIVIELFLLVLVVSKWVDKNVTLIILMAETILNLNPLLIIPVGMSSVQLWRERYFQTTPFIKNWRITQSMRTPKIRDIEVKKDAETYFKQLSESWNKR